MGRRRRHPKQMQNNGRKVEMRRGQAHETEDERISGLTGAEDVVV
jgi:hypothetical protein